MTPDETTASVKARIQKLVEYLPSLRDGQLRWIERIVDQFRRAKSFWRNPSSPLVTDCFLEDFGDALRIHHCFSDEAFTKDKFEYTMVSVFNQCGQPASLETRNNPGHDVTIGSSKVSLKTQADKGLRTGLIQLHKFMELGRGQWTNNPTDLLRLTNQFLAHLVAYDQILVLRNTGKPTPAVPYWKYELVEIPITLLEQVKTGRYEMMQDSIQMPRPGYCYVEDGSGSLQFRLYFDGGTERKLKVQNIRKDLCIVHAEWTFIIQELDELAE